MSAKERAALLTVRDILKRRGRAHSDAWYIIVGEPEVTLGQVIEDALGIGPDVGGPLELSQMRDRIADRVSSSVAIQLDDVLYREITKHLGPYWEPMSLRGRLHCVDHIKTRGAIVYYLDGKSIAAMNEGGSFALIDCEIGYIEPPVIITTNGRRVWP